MGQHILQQLDEPRPKETARVRPPHGSDSLRRLPARESEPSSRDGFAPRPLRRWLIPIIITVFAFLFMNVAERHADVLKQRLAAHQMESGK